MTIGTKKDGESIRCRSSMVPQAVCSARRRTVSASTKSTLVPNGFERKRYLFGIELALVTERPTVRAGPSSSRPSLHGAALWRQASLGALPRDRGVSEPCLFRRLRHLSALSIRAVRRVTQQFISMLILSLVSPRSGRDERRFIFVAKPLLRRRCV
jgi:hypothetical protein